MNGQSFVQLNQAQGPRGPGALPQQFQGGFPNAHMNQARPTPPPGPPMGQMPPMNPGGQPHHGGDFRRNAFTPSPNGRAGPYDPPSPGSVGSGRRRHGHAGRYARPVIHNALDRRSPPKKEVYDLRTKVNSEEDARNALSSLHVWSIKKDGSGAGLAESGIPVIPTWERATHFYDTGISQEEAARRVWELHQKGDVSTKKSKLVSVIQEQLDHAHEELEAREEDPRFCYQLAQIDQSIKRVDVSPHVAEQYIEDSRRGGSGRRSRSRDRYASKDKRDKKNRDKYYKKGLYLWETPKYKGSKHKTVKQTDSITAYYRRVPREGVNCLQMWDDLQDGYDSWSSANSSPHFSPQQPFAAMGPHPQHGGHQGPHMGMNNPGVQHGFPPPGPFNGQQPGGFPPNQQFGVGGPQGLGLNQSVPNMQQQHHQQHQHGFQQNHHQPGMNNHQGFSQQGMNGHQGFPQQAQYAQGQGANSVPHQGQPGGAQAFPPGAQQNGMQGGLRTQGQAGPHGAQQPFGQDFRHGPQPRSNQVPMNGQRSNPVNRGNMPNKPHGPMSPRPGQHGRQKPGMPPVPPQHGRPGSRNGGKPIRVFPTSPRSSAHSLVDSDDDSGSDSGFDTPASSVDSGGPRGRPRHKNTRSRSRSQSHGPKPRGFATRNHSRGGPQHYSRSVSPPTFAPKSAMRDTSRPGFGRQSPWQNNPGRSGPRRSADTFDQVPLRSRMDDFDRDMLGRKMEGQFNHRFPPRRAYSDDFDNTTRRANMSDFDHPMPRTRMMNDFDDPKMGRSGASRGFRPVSPFAPRRPMFDDGMDVLSDDFENLRFSRGHAAGRGRAQYHGGDQFSRGFKERFRSREYYDDDDDEDEFKRTRFADGAPGRDYGRPTSTPFAQAGGRSFGPRRSGSMYVD